MRGANLSQANLREAILDETTQTLAIWIAVALTALPAVLRVTGPGLVLASHATAPAAEAVGARVERVDEPATLGRMFFLSTLTGSIIGLKLVSTP